MFIYIFLKTDIDLMHKDTTRIYGQRYKYKQIPPQTSLYGSMHHTSNVKVKYTYSHCTIFGREIDNKI